jgi:hypothetical protein
MAYMMLDPSHAGFELSKNKWGVDICLFIVIVITHRRFSIINNGGVVETDPPPQGIPGHLVWGVKQTTGGLNPQPPAIQTLQPRHVLCKWRMDLNVANFPAGFLNHENSRGAENYPEKSE